jgi:hypothetical protein
MENINNTQPNLSASQIKKATLIALISALVIAVVAVLPAQYGKDFTGLGKVLGFSRLYQKHDEVAEKLAEKTTTTTPVKILTLANVGSKPDAVKPPEADLPAPKKQYDSRNDSTKIIIPARKGLEYKIKVLKHGQVKYAWHTNEGVLFVDFHGDVKTDMKDVDYYESFAVANSSNMAGSFIAPYEGKHGWYFKNKTEKDIEVSISMKGEYGLLKMICPMDCEKGKVYETQGKCPVCKMPFEEVKIAAVEEKHSHSHGGKEHSH